jgi:hypothetical protein
LNWLRAPSNICLKVENTICGVLIAQNCPLQTQSSIVRSLDHSLA